MTQQEETKMWAKKTYMHGRLDDAKLWEFTHSLKTQSMYNFLLNDLMSAKGFVRKELVITEDSNGQSHTGLIVFEDKESYDAYMQREEIASIYEYIKILASQNGLDFTVSTVEI